MNSSPPAASDAVDPAQQATTLAAWTIAGSAILLAVATYGCVSAVTSDQPLAAIGALAAVAIAIPAILALALVACALPQRAAHPVSALDRSRAGFAVMACPYVLVCLNYAPVMLGLRA